MQQAMKKIFKLIEKTGEKVIFIDPETGNPYVCMDFTAYEALLDQPKPVENRGNIQEKLEEDVQLWKTTAAELLGTKVEEVEMQEIEAEEGVEAQIVEEKPKNQETEPEEAGKKFVFEEVDVE